MPSHLVVNPGKVIESLAIEQTQKWIQEVAENTGCVELKAAFFFTKSHPATGHTSLDCSYIQLPPHLFQVTVQLPSTGEYGIEVFGNDPSKDAGTYTHICQYYVHFAPPKELQAAFYHDSPEYRAQLAGDDRAAVSRGQHKPDTFGVRGVVRPCCHFNLHHHRPVEG